VSKPQDLVMNGHLVAWLDDKGAPRVTGTGPLSLGQAKQLAAWLEMVMSWREAKREGRAS
jgi:hypothetical protein